MGLYPVECISCKTPIMWFSGGGLAICYNCQPNTITTSGTSVIVNNGVINTDIPGTVTKAEYDKVVAALNILRRHYSGDKTVTQEDLMNALTVGLK